MRLPCHVATSLNIKENFSQYPHRREIIYKFTDPSSYTVYSNYPIFQRGQIDNQFYKSNLQKADKVTRTSKQPLALT